MNSNTKGNIALGQAIAYFTKQCYTISLPLNDCQWYDLIIEKNGIFQTVQVKYCGAVSSNGHYKCKLITVSGTSRQTMYTIKDTPVDLLFCSCSNGDNYLIPTKDFFNTNILTLTRIPLATGFDTSKYLLNNIVTSVQIDKKNLDDTFVSKKTNGKNPVNQYSLDGEYIQTFKNYSEAARSVSAGAGGGKNISIACKNPNRTAYGYRWKNATINTEV